MEEVAQHGAAADCWVAMEGRVYDITAYVEEVGGAVQVQVQVQVQVYACCL